MIKKSFWNLGIIFLALKRHFFVAQIIKKFKFLEIYYFGGSGRKNA